MKDEHISFETAKLAKEKGFNEKSSQYYRHDGNSYHVGILNQEVDNTLVEKGDCVKTTQNLLQRWLRETHALHVGIDYDNQEKAWFYFVINIKEDIFENNWSKNFSYYEDAMENGLLHVLNLL